MKNILVFGRRGQGKTTLGFHLAKMLGLTMVAFDPNDQLDFSPLYNPEDLEAALNAGEPLTIYRPRIGEEVDDEFNLFARVLWNGSLLNPTQNHNTWIDLTILIDEAGLPELQDAGYCLKSLRSFVCRGRDINLIQTVHRPRDAWKTCRANATDWYLFHTTDPGDLAAIAEQCGEEVAEAVSKLDEKQFVHYQLRSGEFEISGEAREWYEPLSATPFEVDLSQVLEVRSHAVN